MKKTATTFVLFIMAGMFLLGSNSVQAQGTGWETLWKIVSRPVPTYTWMAGSLSYTDVAYDPFREYIYVPSPKTKSGIITPHVYILDAKTGKEVGELKMDQNIVKGGFSLGRFCVFKVTVDDSGWIYVGNLVTPVFGVCVTPPGPPECFTNPAYRIFLAQGPYKIYRWKTPQSTPELVYATAGSPPYPEMTWTRWGDDLDAIGHKANTRFAVVGGDPQGVGNLPTKPVLNNEVTVIKFDSAKGNGYGAASVWTRLKSTVNLYTSHAINFTGMKDTDPLWGDSNERVATLMSQNHPPNAGRPYDFHTVSIWEIKPDVTKKSGNLRYLKVNWTQDEYVITCDGWNQRVPSNPNLDHTQARLVDVTVKNNAVLAADPTPPIGFNPLNNSSGNYNWVSGVDYKFNQHTGELIIYVLQSNNGIAAFRKKTPIPLPVELQSFTAETNGYLVTLKWTTAFEENNFGFNIMRSADGGENWEQIGFVQGAGTTTGLRNYSYEDDVQASGIKVPVIKYRLVQVDLDGTSKRSPIVEALITSTPTSVALSQNYPNPFNPVTSISYQLDEPGFVSLKVYDAMGREVATLVDAMKDEGTHTVQFNGKNLPSGSYVYRMIANGKTIEKRMMLLK